MRVFGTTLAAAPIAVAVTAAMAGCSSGDAGAPSAERSASSSMQIKNCLSQPQTRPANITITCADNNLSVTGIVWDSWADESATGAGTEHRNLCEPNCAAGQTVSGPADIELSKPVDGVFTSITITPANGGPQTYPLPT